MRYRRLGYRYAVVMAASRPRPLADVWQPHTASVSMGQPAWRPPTDIIETASEVIVLAELAGVDHEQLDVLLFEDALIVEGERRLPAVHAAGVYHAAEIRQGQVRLELPLPSTIDPDGVEARYERGLLELRLPKRVSPSRPTTIPVSRPLDANVARSASQEASRRTERDKHGS
ncbi:MAG: Hsp20/alpha crystallin family protein [Chloroflexi bacterium]|nr:Hsp20/alpha crystallin family protein [Chloroflexota bacterium]